MIKPALLGALLLVVPPDTGNRQTLKAKTDFFAADNLGNVYVVHGEELQKFLSSGKPFARYSNLKLGAITSIDVTNPLKILLYYRDFQQVVFLDNQLSVNSSQVQLEQLGLEQTYLACASANNSFWIYNRQNNELVRFNEQNKRVAATGNLKQMLDSDLRPEHMLEHNGFLYLTSPPHGIFVFDMFGAFTKLIPLKDVREFQVAEDLIYYRRDSVLCSYDQLKFEEACMPLSAGSQPIGVFYGNRKIYTGYRDSVVITPSLR
jgi:hypothetical protein